MKDSVNSIVENKVNPFKAVWKDYFKGIITKKELQRVLGEWALDRVSHYQYQKIPSMPKGKKYMKGWLVRCKEIKYENTHRKHVLKQLLSRIDEGIIKAEQGKIEEIGEILSGYPQKRKR